MKIAPRPLLVLHEDRAFRRRLRSASRNGYVYREVRDWQALTEAVRLSPPSALVVIDPYRSDASDTIAPELSVLLSDFPSVPVMAAFKFTARRLRDIQKLGQIGVIELIAISHDDTPGALGLRFEAATGRPLKSLLDQLLPPRMDGRVRALMDAAAEIVSAGKHAVDLASRLGISRRTLLRWSHAARVMPPRRLLAWMRILLAIQLLNDRGRTVRGVAAACGYGSDSGLRRVMRKFLDRSPSSMRRRGAMSAASKAFIGEFAAYRTDPERQE